MELHAYASSGECVIHENGIYGLDDCTLAEVVVRVRAHRRTLSRVMTSMRMHSWIIV